jgi:DNA-binding NarL/FixJ family response regulator
MLSLLLNGGEMEAKRSATAQPSPDRLTSRERAVLELILEGSNTKEIANRLKISPKTVSCHRSQINAKIGARNCVELVRYAIRKGLIQP